MKKVLIFMAAFMLSTHAWAQEKPIKVVFDVTSKDEATHQSTMRHVKMMSAAYPDSEFEIVVYGGAIGMVIKDKSTVSEDISLVQKNKNVSVKVCEASMKRHQINHSQLIPGVSSVPDGILEIVTKQGEGWGYIKESHN